MTNVPPVPLTRSGERARAAGIIAAAARITSIEAFRLVDTVDAIAAAALAAAGLDEKTARRVLTTLWEPPTSSAPASRPASGVRVCDTEWTFLRDLGVRIRAVRSARRLGLPAVARTTGILYTQLLDAERGTAILSVLGLYRVAEALEVLPVDLIAEQEPLELLRRLAARMQAADPSPRLT